ncbi:MAG UNVERIFIED_CONTAM: DUF1592 domain-containing protein [Planctomycetaceae bacterium]|jgi:hypothetical protein
MFRIFLLLIQSTLATAVEDVPDFSAVGQPFLQKYCIGCHNQQEKNAELSLESLVDSAAVVQQRRVTDKVLRVLSAGEMPPQDAPVRPTGEESDRLQSHLQAILDHADRNASPDPGRVTMRRLNRFEYRNTIRDLMGVSFDPSADFPADDIGHGFDNIGDVLTLSPVLMERYLAAAETIVDQAIKSVLPPVVKRHLSSTYTEPASGDVASKLMENGFRRMTTDGTDPISVGPLHTPYKWEDGDYTFRTRVYGRSGSDQPVKIAILLQGPQLAESSSDAELATLAGNVLKPARILQTFEVRATEREQAETIELPVPAIAGRDRLMVAIVRPQDGQPAAALWVEYFALDGPLDTRPPSHRKLLACDSAKPQTDQTREVLQRFLRRAWRRSVTPAEVERLALLADRTVAAGESWESGIQLAMQAALCSPGFLFRVEPDPTPNSSEIRPLTEYQVASRLSYFLWSSMPDDLLLDLAETGQLSSQLTSQVRRMLADPKSAALVQSFALQWLQLQRLDIAAPDAALFPMFTPELRAAMKRETELFVDAVFRENRSLSDLIAADFTFLNEPLARHYGIIDSLGNREGQSDPKPGGQPIRGTDFVRVSLQDAQRGGLLTQAGVLTVTSNPTRTSPVKRGRWLLEQILGSPPPAPPPNVPELPASPTDVAAASLRQRMEIHRTNPACANCHAKMDPLGFAFENYDAVGRWRTQDGSFPIDAAGELPDGTKFSGPGELRLAVLSRRKELVRCVCEKLLIYAIGRGLEYYDRPVIEKILVNTAAERRSVRSADRADRAQRCISISQEC